MTLPAVHATGAETAGTAEKAEMSTASATPEIKASKKTFSRRRKRSEATVEHQTKPTDTTCHMYGLQEAVYLRLSPLRAM